MVHRLCYKNDYRDHHPIKTWYNVMRIKSFMKPIQRDNGDGQHQLWTRRHLETLREKKGSL